MSEDEKLIRILEQILIELRQTRVDVLKALNELDADIRTYSTH